MGAGEVLLLAAIVAALALTAFWLGTLIDVFARPRSTWETTGLSRARWALRVALLGWIGTILYWARPRPQLRAAYVAQRAGDEA